MSKEMENLSEDLKEAKAPETVEAQELSDDELDEVSGGRFIISGGRQPKATTLKYTTSKGGKKTKTVKATKL